MTKTGQIKVFMMATAAALGLLALFAASPAEAAFPGNNGKVVFWSDRSTGPGLYTIIPGGTATKIPGTSGGDNAAVWSPDGSRIALQSMDATNAANKEISVMNADGSGRRQLTATPVAEQEPTWSPDGTRIAFAAGTSGTDATTDLEIWMMNADGSGLTQLTNTVQGVRDTEPAWSPLGNQIAFVSEGRTGDTNSNIYVMDTDPATNDAINLTPNDTTVTPVYQWNDEDPSWSPDGTQITYSTIQDVWKMNANGTGKTNLTIGSGGGAEPAWSPDGGSIVYQRSDGTDRNIYVMDNNGGNKTPVDTTLRKDEKPDWQPVPQCTNTNATTGNDVITGTAGKDVLCGGAGNDVINGAGGNDIILGEAGNDTLAGSLGNDIVNGGSGLDRASYANSATPVRVSLTTNFATGEGSDVFFGIENLTGSNFNDGLIGSSLANLISGSGGADSLQGVLGNDTLSGGLGNDSVVGGAGADRHLGDGGNDTLNSRDGVNGNDTLNGSTGTDRCVTDTREASILACP